jgi:hypothetical protein
VFPCFRAELVDGDRSGRSNPAAVSTSEQSDTETRATAAVSTGAFGPGTPTTFDTSGT